MRDLTSGQECLIREIALNNGFSNVEILTSAGSQKGDNYMGIITCVTVKNEDKVMNLVLKTSHTNEEYRKTAKIKEAFAREIYMYETVLPLMESFQREYKFVHQFEGFARYFGCHVQLNSEELIMEDIRKQGYSMCDKKVPFSDGHVTAVLKEFAKLHSVSLALRHTKPDLFNLIRERMNDLYIEGHIKDDTGLRSYIDQMLCKALNIVEGYDTATKALRDFIPKAVDYYKEQLTNPEFQQVFVHGDGWCNNLMFLYEKETDTRNPIKTCLLDWQMSKYSSPAFDLVYFIFTSADKDILRNYDQLLRRYYEVFSENLKCAGCDPETTYSFQTLKSHFKKFAKFGMILAVMNLQIIYFNEYETEDVNNNNGSNITDVFKNLDACNTEESSQRILDLILFLVDNNLF